MKFIATKEFSIGVGGRITSYAIGDVVQPAHANIASAFCEPEGKKAPEPEPVVEPEPAEDEPKPKKAPKKAKKNGKKD